MTQPQHNLPQRRKRFIGRLGELARLDECLREHGLVTIVGTGGMGKTRLAMHYGASTERFQRVVLCDLARQRTLDEFINGVADAAEIPREGTNGDGGRLVRVGRALASLEEVLLIIDNLEQVVDPASLAVRRWLELAPNVTFLATSREPLHLRGERQFRLAPLPVDEAIELFEHRAQQVRPEFAIDDVNRGAVASIVRHLDAVPLAVELAAARINVFSAADIYHRLTRDGGGLETLIRKTRHATVRHQSMHATLYWSWELLDAQEQQVLTQASVFCGGFDLQAAEAVLTTGGASWVGDVLESLVDKSLVVSERAAGAARRFVLFETTREFAANLLADEDRPDLELRHARYFAERLEQARRLNRADDLANVEKAFRSTIGRDDQLAARLALGAYRMLRARADISGRRFEVVDAALSGHVDDPALRAELLSARATCLIADGHFTAAIHDVEAGLEAAASAGATNTRAYLLYRKAMAIRIGGAPTRARAILDDALEIAQTHQNPRAIVTLRQARAMIDYELGAFEESRAQLWSSLELARREGFDDLATKVLLDLSMFLIPLGELEAAEAKLDEARRTQPAAATYRLKWREMSGWLEWYRGRNKRAFETFHPALEYAHDHSQGTGIVLRLNPIRFGLSALDADDDTSPEAHLRAILQTVWNTEDVWTRVQARTRLAIIHLRRREFRDAARLLDQALDEVDQLENRRIRAHVRCWTAVAAASTGQAERAEQLFNEARSTYERRGDRELAADVAYFLRTSEYLSGRVAGPASELDDIVDDLRTRAKERRFQPATRIWRWICYDHLLELADLLEEAASPEAPSAAGGLCVARDGSAFVRPDGEHVDLSSRHALQLIMAELARLRSTGDKHGVSVDDLQTVGWPGEKLTQSAGSSRVYTAIRTLRSMGLDGILLTGHNGYLLDLDVPFEWLD